METNYKKGARKEQKIARELREKGYYCMRSAGSMGEIDLIAINTQSKIIRLIQSKPKTMSQNAKNKIIESLKRFEGQYVVTVEVT